MPGEVKVPITDCQSTSPRGLIKVTASAARATQKSFFLSPAPKINASPTRKKNKMNEPCKFAQTKLRGTSSQRNFCSRFCHFNKSHNQRNFRLCWQTRRCECLCGGVDQKRMSKIDIIITSDGSHSSVEFASSPVIYTGSAFYAYKPVPPSM